MVDSDVILITLKNISITDPPLELLASRINEISSKYFVDSQTHSKRKGSFDGELRGGENINLNCLVKNFLFANREKECEELVSRFAEMDLIRRENTYEDVKRKLYIPLCVGLPGLGKTSFARIAVTSLVQKATGISSPTLQQMLELSQTVAQDIWPDDTCMAGNELLMN